MHTFRRTAALARRAPSILILLALSLATASMAAAAADPVLMVISNQDFWFQDYADTRSSLEAQGLDVVVAATTTEVSRPHAGSGQGRDGGFVRPDLALADVNADDYSAIVFVGGWGASAYQYAFPGDYDDPDYTDDLAAAEANRLIKDFTVEDRPVAAICHGVTVLAWARVDGASPIAGKTVTGWNGSAPAFRLGDEQYADGTVSSRAQIEANGATMPLSGAVGDPQTVADDVIVDGNIITAEDSRAAAPFARAIRRAVRTAGKTRRR